MFFHAETKQNDGNTMHNAMLAVLIAGIAGLILLYGRSIKTFLQVFVRVFLEEMARETKKA